MTLRVQDQASFLQLLYRSSKKQNLLILKSVNRPQALTICEIAFNVLNSNIKLSKYFRQLLSKKASFYKQIADRSINYKKKIQLIYKNTELVYLLLKATRGQVIDIIDGSTKDDTYI
jgi:superfamily I DNA/RNA helicase